VPGPASPIAALISSGLATDAFLFLGYLPRRSSERKEALTSVAGLPYTLIFLETPHRLQDSLQDLAGALGDRRIAVARELTKVHEEIWRGSIRGALEHFSAPRGEFVLVVEGAAGTAADRWPEAQLLTAIRQELAAGETPTALAARLAERSGWPRREIYSLTLKNQQKRMQ
jgi:16S rRNA (cytidine1402-2'-O)-methyltransferase